MGQKTEGTPEPELSDFERRVAEAEAALDAMPAPGPATSRQVIIASREKIKAQAAKRGPGGVEAVWNVYRALGYDVKLSTFRDYVYNGAQSRAARGAETERKARRIRKRAEDAGELQVLPPAGTTESSSNGAPVRARKMT